MGKFTAPERLTVQSLVAGLTIKRVADSEIIREIHKETGKTISRVSLFHIRRKIKRESFKWYEKLREGQFDYIYEFNQRVAEITDLQKRHYEIADSPKESTTVKQTSLAELHRLNITLSNYFDVAPSIIQIGNKIDNSIPTAQQDDKDIIV